MTQFAYTDLKDEKFGLSLGADRFVIKPQQPEVLLQIVEEVLAKPRKTRTVSRKKSPENETKVLEQYNEVLFRKLQKKVAQLEDVIAKQTKTENELRESEQKYRTLITQSQDGVFVVNLEGNFLAVNKVMYENLKYSEDELLSMSIWDIVPEQYIELHKKRIADILVGKAPNTAAEYLVKGKDGNPHYVEILSAPYYEGKKLIGFQGIARDITERKKVEKKLEQSEERYRSLVEEAFEGIIVIQDGKILFANPRAYEIIDYSRDQTEPRSFTDFVYAEDREKVIDRHLKRLKGEQLEETYPIRLVDQRGIIKWTQISTALIDWEGKPATLTFLTDITERKLAEEQLQESEARYRLLAEHTTDTIRLMDMNLKTKYLSPSAAKQRGFTHQEMLELPMEKQLAPESFRAAIGIFSKEISRVESDPGYNPVHTLDLEYCCKDGTTVWAESKFSVIRDSSGEPISILVEARDITERKLAEENLVKSYESVKKTLNDAINTMVKIVEMRDPYTAGHQHKVAQLATAIAREMKWEDTRIDQLRTAAVVHDVGKMYIPSDILSRPGRLSEIEFNLIKTHAQSGYDIVRGMDFPGNIAKAVLQHHERLDGSGYPNGLKSEDTLLEAKILAVADVIEAMCSHRPYRPALGLEKAFEEISKNRGKLYDPDVVAACLKLFTEKGFNFTEL
ncbi:MAG: PAS domain S-box protein [Chloroflexi bacterium]|nr:PAS domain S-box protein [Chloroflexota bacterium]